MRARATALAALLAVLTAACQPDDLSGNVTAYVYKLDPATGSYAIGKAQIENLESLRALRGRDFDLRAAAAIVETFDEARIERGRDFTLEYTIDSEGAVVPGDLHSLYALSLYRSFDRVSSLLRAMGHVPRRRYDVLYYPRMDSFAIGDGRATFTDNAAFYGDGFLVVPAFLLGDRPLLLNEGVVAHEYGHAVVAQEAFGERAVDVEAPGHACAARHFNSMNEGVADLIAFVTTADPNFIATTLDVGDALDRDLSKPRDLKPEDVDALGRASSCDEKALADVEYDPHVHGSTLARAVYELWPKSGAGPMALHERVWMLERLLATLRRLDYSPAFSLATFPNTLVPLLAAAERPAACTVLRARFAPLAKELTACAGY